jgi:hypothetical protein
MAGFGARRRAQQMLHARIVLSRLD